MNDRIGTEYRLGLHEIGEGSFAYLQPDGGWGWSNAGLITSNGESLLVDTLFDLHLTRAMLNEMSKITSAAPISNLVNTPRSSPRLHAPRRCNTRRLRCWPR